MKRKIILCLVACCAMSASVIAAEVGYRLRNIDLKAKPYLDAATLAKLPGKTEIEILTRQGAWMQVKSKAQGTGYVRMLQLRLCAPAKAGDGNGWIAVVASPTGPARPTTTAAVTTGVRGFSEEAAGAGYDPWGLPSALQTIAGVNPNDNFVKLLFKTHPAPAAPLDKLALAMGISFDAMGGGPQSDSRSERATQRIRLAKLR